MLWFVPVVIRGREYEFIVDTGASITTITPRTAALADVTATGQTVVNGRIAARTPARRSDVAGRAQALRAPRFTRSKAERCHIRHDRSL
jgi:Aspartyl protease